MKKHLNILFFVFIIFGTTPVSAEEVWKYETVLDEFTDKPNFYRVSAVDSSGNIKVTIWCRPDAENVVEHEYMIQFYWHNKALHQASDEVTVRVDKLEPISISAWRSRNPKRMKLYRRVSGTNFDKILRDMIKGSSLVAKTGLPGDLFKTGLKGSGAPIKQLQKNCVLHKI